MKKRKDFKLEKTEGTEGVVEHRDSFLIVIPFTPGYASILLIDNFGELIIKGEFILTQR